jgi:HSP20 family protein
MATRSSSATQSQQRSQQGGKGRQQVARSGGGGEGGRGQALAPLLFDPLVTLRREMERMVDQVCRGGGLGALPGLDEGLIPAIDMRQTDQGLEVTAEVPGMGEEDIELSIDDNVLTIRGEKRVEVSDGGGDGSAGYRIMERARGVFVRSIPLPFPVDEDNITAEIDNGVLQIMLPRAQQDQRRGRRIDVQRH